MNAVEWQQHFMRLNDGKEHFIDKGCIVRTIRELCDENWKSQLVHKYPNIPKDTEVRVYDINCNFYGRFIEVIYNGRIYNICPKDVILTKGVNDNDPHPTHRNNQNSRQNNNHRRTQTLGLC